MTPEGSPPSAPADASGAEPPAALVIGPPTADLSAPPAETPPPSTVLRKRVTVARVVGVALVLVALSLPLYLALTSPAVRATGAGGFLAIFLSSLGLLVSAVGFWLARTRPRALGLVALAAGLGLLALLVGALGARWGVGAAAASEAPDALRAWEISVAHQAGRTSALLGLGGVFALALGVFGLVRAARARERMQDERSRAAGLAGEPLVPPSRRELLVPYGAAAAYALAGLGALVFGLVTAFTGFEAVAHPHEARLVAIRELSRDADLTASCAALEEALAPDYAPTALLDQHLPDREELAHRCVTLQIDALPKGLPCVAAAGVLAKSHVVRVARAEDRVVKACARIVGQ